MADSEGPHGFPSRRWARHTPSSRHHAGEGPPPAGLSRSPILVLALLSPRGRPPPTVFALAIEHAAHRRRAVSSAVPRRRASRPPWPTEAAGPRADRPPTTCTKSVTTHTVSGLVASELALAPAAALRLGPPRLHRVALSPLPVPPRGLPPPERAPAVRVSAVALLATKRSVTPATSSPEAPSRTQPSTAPPSRACTLALAQRELVLPRGTARGGCCRSGPLLVPVRLSHRRTTRRQVRNQRQL